MKFIVEVEEQKVQFFLELVQQLNFATAKPLNEYKASILEGMGEAVDQVNLAKEGKSKLKPARDLLDEI